MARCPSCKDSTLVSVSATAPSHWASYLVNGDGSGLEPDEADAAEKFVDTCLRGIMPVSCVDAGFIAFHSARSAGVVDYAADCQTYISLAPAKDNRASGPGEETKRKAMADCGRILRRYRLVLILFLAGIAWLATYSAGVASELGARCH